MLNRITLIGRLTAGPETKTVSQDFSVCNFKLAVDRDYKNKEGEKEADFFNISARNKLGEICQKNLSKGKLCCVEGRMQFRQYEKDGQKLSYPEVIADNVYFLSPKE